MRLPAHLLATWRRQRKATVVADVGFLSPEERAQAEALQGEHGPGHRGSRLAADEDLGPASFRRPE